MRFVIVTGMSGAGKSTALKMMEDMGYFCVDNMPIPLMSKLTELLLIPNEEITKLALGLDIRSGQNLKELEHVLDEMDRIQMQYEILFLDANDEIIGYKFVSLGKFTDFIKSGDTPNEAWEKAQGQYGRVEDAVKIIDPRKE